MCTLPLGSDLKNEEERKIKELPISSLVAFTFFLVPHFFLSFFLSFVVVDVDVDVDAGRVWGLHSDPGPALASTSTLLALALGILLPIHSPICSLDDGKTRAEEEAEILRACTLITFS